RETFLVPVDWVDDWPVVNGGRTITLTDDSPLLYHYSAPIDWRDDFTSPTLQLGWYRKNTPVKKDYTLLPPTQAQSDPSTENGCGTGTGNGTLRLHGAPYTLSTPSCPTLFLRKQTARFCLWETKLRFFPDSVNVEAGTVVYLNYFTQVSIGIRLDPDPGSQARKRVIRFTPRNTGAEAQGVDVPLVSERSDVVLLIECGDAYRFGFREVLPGVSGQEVGREVHWVGSVGNRAVVEAPLPAGAPFTGVMLGVYSCGDREAVRVPADFAYVQLGPVGKELD
ncbi:concanavalin A-like lectin/glucanase domain-containing protein, partial [Aspergillus aurantiobrunneus]